MGRQSSLSTRVPKDFRGPPMAEEDWVAPCQELCQGVIELEWCEMHSKLKDVARYVGVKNQDNEWQALEGWCGEKKKRELVSFRKQFKLRRTLKGVCLFSVGLQFLFWRLPRVDLSRVAKRFSFP